MEMMVIAVIAIIAFALVLIPLFRRGTRSTDDDREFGDGQSPQEKGSSVSDRPQGGPADTPPEHDADSREERIEREVRRYRTALRAGTLCTECGQANPASSAFCYECGRRLPQADAREFE
jgi:hypothetical protein